MDHDRLIKQLLTTFFFEFIELFLPAVARYLSRKKIEFLDKEIFTDLTGGMRQEVDVVAKVRFRNSRAFFLILAEGQNKPQARFPRRIFHYVARLDEKYDLPVYPVAVFTFDAPRRAEADRYRIAFPDRTVLDFSFTPIQLNRRDWKDFVGKDNPVASALMAKMRIAPGDRPVVKLACVRMMLRLPLNPAKRTLLREFVDAYLRLDAPELAVYDQEVAKLEPPEKEKVMKVLNEWEEAGLKKGMEKGREQGLAEGLLPFLHLLRRAVGKLPPKIEQQVRRLPAPRLEALADALPSISTRRDLEKWLAGVE